MGLETAAAGLFGLQMFGQGLGAYQQYKVNKYNAGAARFDAQMSLRASEKEAERLVEEEAMAVGRARAIAGASGIAVDEGSNQDVLDDIRRVYAEDIAAVRVAGKLGVYQGERAAGISEAQGMQAITAGILNMGTTALSYTLSRPSSYRQTTGVTGANRTAGQGGTASLGGI